MSPFFALAILLLIPVWAGMFPGTSAEYVDSQEYNDEAPSDQVIATSLAEAGVRNIYAYDAQGQPLSSVQLFDQEGRPSSRLHGCRYRTSKAKTS
jgi:hypothetical protein